MEMSSTPEFGGHPRVKSFNELADLVLGPERTVDERIGSFALKREIVPVDGWLLQNPDIKEILDEAWGARPLFEHAAVSILTRREAQVIMGKYDGHLSRHAVKEKCLDALEEAPNEYECKTAEAMAFNLGSPEGFARYVSIGLSEEGANGISSDRDIISKSTEVQLRHDFIPHFSVVETRTSKRAEELTAKMNEVIKPASIILELPS